MAARTKYDREAILAATAAEIAVAGFDGASVAAIARRLGAPSGSIYHRYRSKQHLLGALWVDIFTGYRDALAPVLDREVSLDVLATDVVALLFRWVEQDPDRAGLLMRFRTEDFDALEWPDEVVAQVKACNAAMAADMGRVATRYGLDQRDLLFALVDIPAAAARRSLLIDDPASTVLLRDRATRASRVLLTGTPD